MELILLSKSLKHHTTVQMDKLLLEVIPKVVDLPLEVEVEDLHQETLEEDLLDLEQLETIVLVDSKLEARAPQLQSNHPETLVETLKLQLELVVKLEETLKLQVEPVIKLEETLQLQLVEILEETKEVRVEKLIHHQRALLKSPIKIKISLAILLQLTSLSLNFMEFQRKLVITRRMVISGTSVLISRTPNLSLRKMERI